MFRKMRRSHQALRNEEIISLLKNENRGVLSVLGDDGYPYGMPMDHYYDEEANLLFFHGASSGHRVDALRRNDKVSYCVFGQEQQKEGDWAKYVKSVIVFGRAELLTDPDEITGRLRKLGAKFPCPPEYVEKEIREDAAKALCFVIHIESMTGKLVHEA